VRPALRADVHATAAAGLTGRRPPAHGVPADEDPAGTTEQLQAVLRRLFDVVGVSGTQTIVVLETFFERPVSVTAQR
jgi:hypothetical protein